MLIPWDPRQSYTDKTSIPRVVSTIYDCIKTSESLQQITQSSSAAVFGTLNFQLQNQDPDYAQLAAVFDQYRIREVEVLFRPRITEAVSNATSNAGMGGQLTTVIDYDDSSNLATVAAALAYTTAITTPLTVSQRRCLIPKMAVAAYGGGTFSSYANLSNEWCDAASATVVHFGLKYAIDIGLTGYLQTYDVVMRTHFQWRSSR